jgi:hypothetical protein
MATTLQSVPTDFNKLTLEQVKQLRPEAPERDANRPYIDGDHLQNGDAWVGPGPRQNNPGYKEFMSRLEVVFTSKNVILEVCNRLVSAVMGREPRWAWVPRRIVSKDQPLSPEEIIEISLLEGPLTEWWDQREIHKLMKRMLLHMMWSSYGLGRMFVPYGLTENGRVPGKTLEEVLRAIYLDVPEPEDAFMYQHPLTMALLVVVMFKTPAGQESAELTFLDKQGQTVIKVLPEPVDGEPVAALDLQRQLTMFQVTCDNVLPTQQVRQLQNMLNMSLTLLGKGLVDTHFLERIFHDTLPPGDYQKDPANPDAKETYVPDLETGRKTGDRTDSYMQSTSYVNEDDQTTLATGKVTIREPTDPAYTIKGAEYWYQCLLEEVRQDHILINQAATPSGKSRDESRVDFADSGKDPELQSELAGRALLMAVVTFAEALLGKPGQWTKKYKPIFKTNARYGKLSVDERRQTIDEADKGYRSKQGTQSLIGIDDTDAEEALISGQPNWELALSDKRADVVTKFSADFPRSVALFLAGYSDDEIKEIMDRVKQSVAEDPAAAQSDPKQPLPQPEPVKTPTQGEPTSGNLQAA